jgi:phage baseplate assembly protein W
MSIQRIDKNTSANRPKEIYSDFLTNFNAHPNTGALLKRSDEEAVKRSIRNLLLTDVGERFFQPNFGSNVRRYLFENASDVTKNSLRESIVNAINNYEPRANIIDVIVTLSNDEHSYMVDIYFNVINNPTVVVFNVQLDRVR